VLPEDDDNDPMIYVEETITVTGKEPAGEFYIEVLSSDEEYDEENEGDGLDEISDDAANKLTMAMMLSGEHPDEEIDKLLETFGISPSMID